MENNLLEQELENWQSLRYRMENEGIDYCFEHYSRWEEIQDEEFHKLRVQFLETLTKLRELTDKKINELNDKILYE